MPRPLRSFQPGVYYHVMNRAAARAEIFRKEADYAAFERILTEVHDLIPLRILSYVLMPSHFHLVVWPGKKDHERVSEFMRRLLGMRNQQPHFRTSARFTAKVPLI